MALWLLGYPETALLDTKRALKDAHEVSHATTLMYALTMTSLTHICRGDYAAAIEQTDEVMSLADEKGAGFWKAYGMLVRGWLFGLTDKCSDAIDMINAGITAWRSTGAKLWMPWYLSYLAMAHAKLGQFDDAWRYIGEAMIAMDMTIKERWCEAEVYRVAGEIALMSPDFDEVKAEANFEHGAQAARQILGTPRRHEPRASLARPGQGAASARTVGSGLRVVYGGVRHA
jgi:hypothetical protein